MRINLVLLTFLVACTVSLLPSSVFARNNFEVTLQLKWTHAFQFAGYYAAKEMGYYKDAGIDVTITEAKPGVNPVTEVIEGRAHFGVGNSSLLLYRNQGLPVVVLNVIFQHSPAVIISRGADTFPSLENLRAKRIMIEPNSDELLAYLNKSGVPEGAFERVEHSYQVDDLINGNVDAISAYSSYEPYLLSTRGFYFHMFTPRESGIDFYGDNLFTSQPFIDQYPAQVEAFRKASLKGWNYAMKHPEKVMALILKEYAPELDPNLLVFEAQIMQGLLAVNLVEIGHMNLERWKRIVSTYDVLGHAPKNNILRGFIYEPYVSFWQELNRYKWYLALALLLFMILAVRNYQLRYFNRQLNKMANEDSLTELFNRKHMDDALTEEHLRCVRYGRTYSVIMCDIDHFKAVNDKHGHHIGDIVLKEVATTLKKRTRSTDILGRWGGEEFLLVCPETDYTDALATAEALRTKVAEQHYTTIGEITLSVGVATLSEDDEIIDIVKRADKAMYCAKKEGRNQVKGQRVQASQLSGS